MAEYWTLEGFENAGVKEFAVEGKMVKIKAIDPKLLLKLFHGRDIQSMSIGTQASPEDLLKQYEVLEAVIIEGLVEPKVTLETIDKLGKFKQVIGQEILAFSGLAKEESDQTDAFREEPTGSNG